MQFIVLLVSVGLVLAGYGNLDAASASPDPSLVRVLAQLVQDAERKVHEWEQSAKVTMTLTALIGVLGIVVGLLQTANRPWLKAVTVAVGAVVSIVTVVNNTVFPVDHRIFRQRAAEGEKVVREMRLTLVDLNSAKSEENIRALRDELLAKFKRIEDIEVAMQQKATTWLAGTAWAQERVPSWVSKLPPEDAFRFFVGEAQSSDLGIAQEASIREAREQAVLALLNDIRRDRAVADVTMLKRLGLREAIPKIAETSDAKFLFEENTKMYRSWTLIRLSKQFFAPSLWGADKWIKTESEGAARWVKRVPSVRDKYFSIEGRVRISFADIVVGKEGVVSLSFQSRAMTRGRFPGNNGPEVSVLLLDGRGMALGESRRVVTASIESCGGYKDYEVKLTEEDFSTATILKADHFSLKISRAVEVAC